MKKNTLFFACLGALSLCTWESQALTLDRSYSVVVQDNVPSGYETIELLGTMMYGINPNGINAGVNRSSVFIHFEQSVGNVNISIYNASGALIYSTVVNTSVQQSVIIPLTDQGSGTYTLELSNANGYAEGDFNRRSF